MNNRIWPIFICFVLLVSASARAEETADEKSKTVIKLTDTIELSGELRFRFEAFDTASFGTELQQTLARTRIALTAKPADGLTVFVQFQDSRVWGEEPSVTASTENVDLHQGYVEYRNIGDTGLGFKIGRQELSYGDQRLVGAFGWSNIGRSFDAAMLFYDDSDLRVDGFISTTHESFTADSDAEFGGVYAMIKKTPVGQIDLYALIKRDARLLYAGEFAPELGDLMVNTFGLRLAGSLGDTPLSYKGEFAFQTGDYGPDSLEAWALHASAAWKVDAGFGLVILGEYNYATGDADPTDGTVETFDNLFPTNHNKYGYIDFVGWRNIKNIRFGVSATPAKGHTVAADYHLFSLAETADNAYRASGAPLLVVPVGNTEDEIGQEFDLTWRFSPLKGLGALVGYSHFFAGELFNVVLGEADDSDFLYGMLTVKF